LPNSAKALKGWMINYPFFPFAQLNKPVYRAANFYTSIGHIILKKPKGE